MAPLKRKRSSPSALSPSTTTTNSSTSRSTSPSDIQMSDSPTAFTTTNTTAPPDPSPAHLDSGRTRKRFRDNRPDEETVYANTYATLFAASASASASTRAPHPSPPPPPPQTQQQPQRQGREGSLHNHWIIRTPPPVAPQDIPPAAQAWGTRCEDCDAPLLLGSEDVSMGGMDGVEGEGEYTCGGCGKRVCDGCAVVGVGGGSGRDCLGCLTKTKTRGVGELKWVGGIGWCP